MGLRAAGEAVAFGLGAGAELVVLRTAACAARLGLAGGRRVALVHATRAPTMGRNEATNVERLGGRGWKKVENPEKVRRKTSTDEQQVVVARGAAKRKADERRILQTRSMECSFDAFSEKRDGGLGWEKTTIEPLTTTGRRLGAHGMIEGKDGGMGSENVSLHSSREDLRERKLICRVETGEHGVAVAFQGLQPRV